MARIYVSSTFKDLEEYRNKVRMALSQMGHVVMAMEYYVAENNIPFDNLLEDIASCSLYIGIFAWRYGYVPDGYDKSITELEYRKAIETGKECLIFLLDEAAPWPPSFVDKGKDAEKIKALRNELSNKHACAFFRSSDELSSFVITAVHNWESKIKTKTPTASPSFRKTPFKFAVPGFASDIRAEQDLVGIGAEIDAFAYLIAAKTLQPPMAIGLFGDWGSGKSFFMEALRKRIHTITADAQQSGKPQKKISIYKYIAQIEFNAWHYVEGELWASLVEHIFRNLKTRAGDKSTLLQQRQQIVIEKLEIKRRAQQEAQARKAELEIQLSQAKERVTKLEKERDNALQNLNKLRAKDILKSIPLTEIKDYEKDIQTLKNLSVMKDIKNASDLMQSVDELRAVLERGNALTIRLRERGLHGRMWAATLVLIIFIGPVVSFGLSRISVPPITNALVSVATFLSGLTIMLKQGTTWLSKTLSRVEDIRIKLDAKLSTEAEKYGKDIAEAEHEYNEKVAEYDQAKNEEKEKVREIDELEQELQRITPGRLLLDFINERVCSLDYRKHLGIASLIRSDFEQLSQLIMEQNEMFITKDDGITKEEDQHLVNRIVLYIDDLDRCPPDKVVQVLQAVHLLLAFPLFVVVVAVDARWLSQSLQAHYKSLLTDSTQLGDQKFFGRQASSQDYLEKIFQIPFWVRPLSEKSCISIVEGLVKESLVPSLGTNDGNGKKQKRVGKSSSDDTVSVHIREELVNDLGLSEGKRLLDLNIKTDLTPQGLDIEEIELQFIDDLRSLLGQTPRSVKRFVNIYRLIKAISLNQGIKFVEDRPYANFKLVLFLLAVLTGLPSISSEFLRQLRAERSDVEQALKVGQQSTVLTGRNLAQVLNTLHSLVISGASQTLPSDSVLAGQGTAATIEKNENDLSDGRRYEDWYVCRDLDRLESWFNRYKDGSWLNLDATALADWAPQVVRFSYRIEEL